MWGVENKKRVLCGPPLIFKRKKKDIKKEIEKLTPILFPFSPSLVSIAQLDLEGSSSYQNRFTISKSHQHLENMACESTTARGGSSFGHKSCHLPGPHLRHEATERHWYLISSHQGGRGRIARSEMHRSIERDRVECHP